MSDERELPASAIDLTEKDFPWHVKSLLVVCFIAIAALILVVWGSHSKSDLARITRDALWTTYTVGNPSTVELANLRTAKSSAQTICGRINYEKNNNRGWSGYTDFFIENGVMYISPPAGQYFQRFKELCITPAL